MMNLFIEYDFIRFMDGTYPCPPIGDQEYKNWICQDQVLFLAI